MNDKVQQFEQQLASAKSLVPRTPTGVKRKVAHPAWTKQVVTIVGVKTVLNRFMPVSHEGHSNESYVDRVDLLGRTRAEFISRKMKGIERRMHMALFRELAAAKNDGDWQKFFKQHFDTTCVIPDGLCIACWNCALFGGLDARAQIATFSRIRYFDTFSVEPTEDCVGSMDNEEMGIGNQVYEDLVADKEGKYRKRTAETYHLYEYVKAGTRFPFITMIESPTLLDVAGMLHAIRRADAHGYGKYSANHGKFSTELLAMATGFPRFSVLDMLTAMEDKKQVEMVFDGLAGGGEPALLAGEDIESVASKLQAEFEAYVQALS
jgi:CRISPR type I-D-associated protein Csc2